MPLPPPPPPTARPLFSRLASADVDPEEGGRDDDGGPAHRGIMDLRDIGTRRRGAGAAAEEPSLLPPPLPTLELLLATPRLLLPLLPLLADDGLGDGGGGGGGFACAPAPARVCRRGLTGMVGWWAESYGLMMRARGVKLSPHEDGAGGLRICNVGIIICVV